MKKLTKISLLLFFITSICYAQSNPKSYINDMGNSNANFYTIESQYDSLLRSGQLDGSNEKLGLHFARWKWFWESRMGDAIDQVKSGEFTHYFDVLNTLTTSPVCNSSSQYPANWNLLGPIQLPRQEIGRMDAVVMDPNNNSVVYAGAPLSGLWRTMDITAATPVWENVTDSEHLPGLGIEDILIDPANSNVIYIATGLGFTSGYGVGVLKTTTGTSSNPQWDFTDLSYDPFVGDKVRVRKLLMQPSNHSVVYAITDREVFKTTDGGTNWPSFGFFNATNNNVDIDLRNIVFDPLNNSNIIVSGREVWRWNNSTSQWTDITGNLTSTPTGSIVLAVSGNNIYALYDYKIDISTDGGITWSSHTSTNQKGPLFIVSSANPNIMYIGDGTGRVIYKSTNGGTTFSAITSYNGTYNGTSTHADIRGLQLASASQNGLNDVLLAGTDGGILYSTSADSPSGFPANWTDATGTGLAVSEFYGLAGSEKVPGRIVAGSQDNGFATYDNNTWINEIVGDAYEMLFDRENPDIVYGERIGWGWSYETSQLDDGIYFRKSIDGGQTWSISFQQPEWGNQSNPDNVGYSPDIWNVKSSPIEMDHNNNFTVGFHDLFKYNSSNYSWTPLSDFTAKGVEKGYPCSSFKIAPSNPDIIYFAFENPTWNATIKKKLWKTSDGGVSWTDVTNNLPVTWAGISCITIDPTDPDRVWVSFYDIWSNSNLTPPYNGVNRVLFSANGGTSWSDYSTGLTSLPVNSIIYQKGTDDGLYVGTDVGVFYRNNTMSQWECFSDGFPVAIVTDLEINYCSGKIICSTYGRGVWESDLAETSDIYYEICSGTPETWDVNMFSVGGVKICTGNTLTITSKIELTENAKIIIEPGGKLILNGGTLTNACDSLWGGIEVWGDPEATQIPANQGWLSVSNGGTIENAVVAVRVGSEDYANKGGGIVSTTEAIVRNNRAGVIYHEYAGSNIGNFTLTTFETTAELVDSSLPEEHLRLLGVEGITINGCTFRNTRDGNTPYSQRGTGIISFDASYDVDQICISGTTPCTQYQETVFDSLYYSIEAYALSSVLAPSVENTGFTHNFRGVYTSGITYALVKNCYFVINTPFATDGGYGLYLDNSTAYTIEENNFYSSMASPTGIGIIVQNSGTDPNEIYRNWFTNLDQGISAQEQNRDPRSFLGQGLQILCCEFNDCNFDILVPQPLLSGRGIALHQGANTQNAEDMAGNLFDIHGQIPDGDFDDINNQGAYFSYYYPINYSFGYQNVKPIDYTRNTVNRVGILVLNDWSYETDCPPSASGGGAEESGLRASLTEAVQEINTTEQTLANLIDGGETEALYQEVENSYPPETLDVYNELMDASPYLSDTVVGATIDKEDVIPGAMLRDVMVANPHSAKSEKLMEKLDERYTPLPEYMKAQILESRNLVSMKEELESKLSKYRLQKLRAFSGLLHHYLSSDSIPGWRDSITNLLAIDNDLQSKYRLALWQLQNGDLEQSGITLNSISGMFDLQGSLLATYNDMVSLHGVLTDVLGSDSGWHSISPIQIQQLSELEQATAPAAVYARNILIMAGNLAYNEPIQLPNLLKSSEAEDAYTKALEAKMPSVLELYPNPADDYIILGYRLDLDPVDLSIEIRNLKGELIKTLAISEKQNQQVVNTETWQAGIYIVSLKQNGEIIDSVKLTLVD